MNSTCMWCHMYFIMYFIMYTSHIHKWWKGITINKWWNMTSLLLKHPNFLKGTLYCKIILLTFNMSSFCTGSQWYYAFNNGLHGYQISLISCTKWRNASKCFIKIILKEHVPFEVMSHTCIIVEVYQGMHINDDERT